MIERTPSRSILALFWREMQGLASQPIKTAPIVRSAAARMRWTSPAIKRAGDEPFPCGAAVLEALASGVPGLVTNEGGPQFIVEPGCTGYICEDNTAFTERIRHLTQSPEELESLRAAARNQAESSSWDNVFAAV
jgi:glycosyltransferase involved in cell wall biosynthesis